MSKLLENLRSLRDEVVRPVSGCNESGDAVEANWGRKSSKPSRKKKIKRTNESFLSWMKDVTEAVEDICGMGVDILQGTPWRELYREGTDPREAAEWALGEAEIEGGLEENEETLEEVESLEEFSFGKPDYLKWTKKLDKILRKKWGTTLIAAKKVAQITNPALHSIFMSNANMEMAARMIMRAAALENTEEDTGRQSLRRRGYIEITRVNEKDDSYVEEESDVFNPLGSLMEEFSVKSAPKPKSEPLADVEKFMQEAGMTEDISSLMPVAPAAPRRGLPMSPGSGLPDMTATSADPMGEAVAAVQRIAVAERRAKESFEDAQRRKQKEDEDALDRLNKSQARASDSEESEDLDEASVLGGDYGRWKPATSAAGAAGPGLAAAVSKAEGVKYSFIKEGTPQSSDVGSDLWFVMEPPNPAKNLNYYLGIKIKGDKDSPTWDVVLKKGKGLGSSSSIGSERGLETSGIKGAIGKLKNGLTKSKDSE